MKIRKHWYYSEESGFIRPNPCFNLFMECEGDCKNCPNKNYWDEKPCPFCSAPLQNWRFNCVERYKKNPDPEYLEMCMVNNPDLTPEHALYHIPESC